MIPVPMATVVCGIVAILGSAIGLDRWRRHQKGRALLLGALVIANIAVAAVALVLRIGPL